MAGPGKLELPAGWGTAQIDSLPGVHAGDPRDRCVRSRDHLGATLTWFPEEGTEGACDMEHRDRDPSALAAMLGVSKADVLRRWTVTESIAKLTGTPVLHWIRMHGFWECPADGESAIKLPAHFGGGIVRRLVLDHDARVLAFVKRPVKGSSPCACGATKSDERTRMNASTPN